MPSKTYEIKEGGSFGLEIRVPANKQELARLENSLRGHYDAMNPTVYISDFHGGLTFGRTPEVPENPISVYFFATRKDRLMVFEFGQGNISREFIERFLEGLGYKPKTNPSLPVPSGAMPAGGGKDVFRSYL
jgi:hypothetical protein